MTNDFVHLHVHDQFSVLDGYGTSQQYVDEAKRIGQKFLALTNHGNVDGVIKFQKSCNKAGIKGLIGSELYIVEDMTIKEKGYRRYHMTVIVKNDDGWRNLLKILTIANNEGFYYKPRIDLKTFVKSCSGLVVLTGCANSVMHIGEEAFVSLVEAVDKGCLFVELMPHKYDEQIATNNLGLEYAEKYNLGIVATNDCHYPSPEHSVTQEMLLSIQTKAKWSDSTRWKFNISGLYLKSARAMEQAFKQQDMLTSEQIEMALNNTAVIAELCKDFSIKQVDVDLPTIFEGDEVEILKNKVYKGLEKIWPNIPVEKRREYRQRVEFELETIINLKFSRYFLIVWELMDWCKKNDIMTGPGRGSVGGSIVAYLLGATSVDPIKHGLIFARFISPDRIDLPDIDMDFEDIKRDKVRAHLQEIYGEENVAGLSTFGTMKGKASIRDVARVLEIPDWKIKEVLKQVDERDRDGLTDVFNSTDEGRLFSKDHPEATNFMIALEGQIRNAGQHAAAVCISKNSLFDGSRCCIVKRSDTSVANWDKNDAEYMGLMKLDVLGLSALTVLNEAKHLIKQNHGVDVDFNSIDIEDKQVFKAIHRGLLAGIFQFGGTKAFAKYCKELIITDFETVVHATSIWRPGPLKAGMHEEFRDRKVKGKKYEHINPAMEKITSSTFGIVMYQEQVMFCMNELAGMSWKECDKVRKVIGKSKGDAEFNKFKEAFISGCKNNGMKDVDATKIWNEICKFGGYGFNKSHAVEYSLITYWDLWLKTYYPTEFYAASLTYGADDKKDNIIDEAYKLDIGVRLSRIGFSKAINWTCDANHLYAPFIEIKGVGDKSAIKLAEHQPKKQETLFKTSETKGTGRSEAMLNLIQEYEDTGKGKSKVQELFNFTIPTFEKEKA